MIYGAEGIVGIVNIVLLLGMLALVILLVSIIRYKRSINYREHVNQHTIRYCFTGLVLGLIALPTVAFMCWAGWDYVTHKHERETFERNNQHASELYSAMQEDNLVRFKQALITCGDYCLHADPGEKKYDELLISAGYAKASKITAYLNSLNHAEIVTPHAQLLDPSKSTQWVEVDAGSD